MPVFFCRMPSFDLFGDDIHVHEDAGERLSGGLVLGLGLAEFLLSDQPLPKKNVAKCAGNPCVHWDILGQAKRESSGNTSRFPGPLVGFTH